MTDLRLQEWPDLQPVSTTLLQLRLDSNNITEFSTNTNPLSGMTMLESLRLQRNRLSYVPAGPLDSLTSLKDLRLNYNNITRVADFAFKDLGILIFSLDLGFAACVLVLHRFSHRRDTAG